MQAGKNAAASVKEAATNVSASARSGMEKTKATVQEKVDKLRAHDELEKQMATEKKQERIEQAELNKQEAREHAAAAKHGAAATGHVPPSATYSTTGVMGHTAGGHQMSAMPGHGTGEPAGGHVVDASEAATGRTTTVNKPRVTRPGTDSTIP